MTAGLAEWLTAQLDADELLAKEAGRVKGEAVGAHWRWVNPDNDEPISVDLAQEHLDAGSGFCSASLRSVEERPGSIFGDLPEFIITSEDEVKSVHAACLVAWDPARVLDEIAAKRRVLDQLAQEDALAAQWEAGVGDMPMDDLVDRSRTIRSTRGLAVKALAQVYRDREGFRDEWRIG